MSYTPYTRLHLHFERHQYKRGVNTGSAPALPSKRWKDHFRVLDGAPRLMWVRFHATNIIRVNAANDTITLNSGGWHDSPNTRAAFHEALALCGVRAHLHSKRFGSRRQTAITTRHGTWRFYDGMEIGQDGTLRSAPVPYEAEVADREERAEFRSTAKAFRSVLPVLHAACSNPGQGNRANIEYAARRSGPPHEDPTMWGEIVSAWYRDTPAATWAAYYADMTRNMTQLVELPL